MTSAPLTSLGLIRIRDVAALNLCHNLSRMSHCPNSFMKKDKPVFGQFFYRAERLVDQVMWSK
jgi:hypothetical protein